MPASITLRFEKPVPGSTGRTYPVFAKNWDVLDDAARELELLSPFDFVSETPAEYAELMKGVKEVEKELDGFDIGEIKNNPEFQNLLQELGNDPNLVKMIQDAQSPDELLGQVFPEESPGEEWYEAEEGVEFTNQLRQFVQENSKRFQQSAQLEQELQEIAAALQAAQASGVKFYFALEG